MVEYVASCYPYLVTHSSGSPETCGAVGARALRKRQLAHTVW